MTKKRLDVLLVERNLIETREKAKRVIMAGLVFSDQQRLDKPGMKVAEDISLTVKGKAIPYVGRGGLKLEKALQSFSITPKYKIMVDVGSSTGGFTDCALQNGAELCYAIDVGYNQLDWKLRNDHRVVVMERTNFRYVTDDMLTKGLPQFATVDVSFISLKLILPVLKQLLLPESDIVLLIKPQFEAGKKQVGKKGVVRDQHIHLQVLEDMMLFVEQQNFKWRDVTHSPITGGEGNIEFLAHVTWQDQTPSQAWTRSMLKNVVTKAHDVLM